MLNYPSHVMIELSKIKEKMFIFSKRRTKTRRTFQIQFLSLVANTYRIFKYNYKQIFTHICSGNFSPGILPSIYKR